MIDSFQSSSISETCGNCDKYINENKILRQRLTASHPAQEQLRILGRIKEELQGIQLIAAQYNIEVEDLAGAFSFALDTLFAIKSKPLVKKGKDAVQLVKQLFGRKENSRKENLLPKEEESSISAKSEEMKIEEKPAPNARSRNSHENSPTQKVDKKKVSQKMDAANCMPTQKQAQIGIFQEMNSYRKKEKRLQNPYVPREPTPSEQKGLANLDEEHQKLSILNKSSTFEEIRLPLVWEKRTFFDMSGKTITKRYNDIYKKICTEKALPRSGKHRIMIEMVTNGTVAFGIVTAAFRNQHMIDDRKCDAVKYLSFENGGGLVKLCGEEILGGERVHLNPGQVLEVDFDAGLPEVTFRNPNLQKPLEIRLTDQFKNKELYFFLEMKQINTSVRFL